MLTKELGIHPDGVLSNSNTHNMHEITDHLIVNQYSGHLQKNYKLEVSQDSKVLASILDSKFAQKSHKSISNYRISDNANEAPN